MDTDSLRVDIADIDDVRAQLPRARDILGRKRSALERCQADYDSFRELVELLAKRAGVDLDEESTPDERPAPEPQETKASDVDMVVEVVNRENRAIRAKTVKTTLALEGHVLAGDKVRDALYYAAKRREPPLIKSLPERGYYAPLSYRADQSAIFANGDGTAETAAALEPEGPGP